MKTSPMVFAAFASSLVALAACSASSEAVASSDQAQTAGAAPAALGAACAGVRDIPCGPSLTCVLQASGLVPKGTCAAGAPKTSEFGGRCGSGFDLDAPPCNDARLECSATSGLTSTCHVPEYFAGDMGGACGVDGITCNDPRASCYGAKAGGDAGAPTFGKCIIKGASNGVEGAFCGGPTGSLCNDGLDCRSSLEADFGVCVKSTGPEPSIGGGA